MREYVKSILLEILGENDPKRQNLFKADKNGCVCELTDKGVRVVNTTVKLAWANKPNVVICNYEACSSYKGPDLQMMHAVNFTTRNGYTQTLQEAEKTIVTAGCKYMINVNGTMMDLATQADEIKKTDPTGEALYLDSESYADAFKVFLKATRHDVTTVSTPVDKSPRTWSDFDALMQKEQLFSKTGQADKTAKAVAQILRLKSPLDLEYLMLPDTKISKDNIVVWAKQKYAKTGSNE